MAFTVKSGTNSTGISGGTGVGIVEAGGNIFETVNAGIDALGPSTITINGGVIATSDLGVVFNSGAATDKSKMIVGVDGSVWSDTERAILAQHVLNLTNKGLIRGAADAIQQVAAGSWTIANSKTGEIYSASDDAIFIGSSATGSHTISNAGIVEGAFVIRVDPTVDSVEKVSNSGSMKGAVSLGKGNDSFTNTGTFVGGHAVSMGEGNDTFSNTKTFNGQVTLGEGVNKFSNSGTFSNSVTGGSGNDTISNTGTLGANLSIADTALNLEGGNDLVTNSKSISGIVKLGDGANTLKNSGTISGDVSGGGNADTITNSGTMRALDTGAGNDVVTNSGTITLGSQLGEGDDKYTGGSKDEFVTDGAGNDTIALGAGSDNYIATGAPTGQDGTDKIDGGSNVQWNGSGVLTGDFYQATNTVSSVYVNLNAASQTNAFTATVYAGNTAYGTDVSGSDDPNAVGFTKDTITGFEHVLTGEGRDVVFGNALSNYIDTNEGDDFLFGGAGNDTLMGGDGSDRVVGGAGRDTISLNDSFGSPDAFKDRVYYFALSDSGVTKATRDVITDFDLVGDKIVFSGIDADSNAAGMNDFKFIGMNESFTDAGQLRAVWEGVNTIVSGDVNGDGKADFSIEFVGRLTFKGDEFEYLS